MPHFSRLLFLKKFQRHMNSICVWDMIKQSKPLQTSFNSLMKDWADKYHVFATSRTGHDNILK